MSAKTPVSAQMVALVRVPLVLVALVLVAPVDLLVDLLEAIQEDTIAELTTPARRKTEPWIFTTSNTRATLQNSFSAPRMDDATSCRVLSVSDGMSRKTPALNEFTKARKNRTLNFELSKHF